MIYTLTLNPAVDRELVVPAIHFDSVLRAEDCRVDFGGKGFNVSRMLHALGTPSAALGFAGGKAGEMLRDGLEALGIRTDFVWVDGETRTNVSIVAADTRQYIKVNEPGPPISAIKFDQMLSKVRGLAQPGDWWVLSGSLPPGVPKDGYAQLIELLHRAQSYAILDCDGEPLHHGCAAKPFFVKPNDVEAGKLTGIEVDSPTAALQAARAIVKSGPEQVVISLGKAGALLVNQTGAWQVHSPIIEARNPIGAGDSLVGGLVWGLTQGFPALESLCWGVACGAATASLDGTAVGSRTQVEGLRSEVQTVRFDG